MRNRAQQQAEMFRDENNNDARHQISTASDCEDGSNSGDKGDDCHDSEKDQDLCYI